MGGRTYGSSATSLARVEILAQTVSDKVESEDCERYCQPRKDKRVRRRLQSRKVARLFNHHAPGWRGRRHAQTQKRKRSFGENCAGHSQAGLDNQRLNRVWQNMHRQDAQIAGAERARGLHKIVLANFQDLSANQSRIADPTNDAEREDQLVQSSAKKSDQRNRQQQTGKGEENIKNVAGQKSINPTTIVPGDCADAGSDQSRYTNDDEADLQRNSGAENDARKNVASG